MGREKGFSLIELLVVMAVIALLMSILMPVLLRVRNHAKMIVCQSNLRQCGINLETVIEELGGRLACQRNTRCQLYSVTPFYADPDQDFFCPMATKKNPVPVPGVGFWGRTLYAWFCQPHRDCPAGSYGINGWCLEKGYGPRTLRKRESAGGRWGTVGHKGANNIPVFLDSVAPWTFPLEADGPAMYEDLFTRYMAEYSIDRHDGRINGLFMDWSVRKIGLKELWTLKWHPKFDTANAWTTAGGVRPEHWPEWMKKFDDY